MVKTSDAHESMGYSIVCIGDVTCVLPMRLTPLSTYVFNYNGAEAYHTGQADDLVRTELFPGNCYKYEG